MAFLTVPKLILRLIKGAALTPTEHDYNLTTLRNFSNSLAALLGVSLNTDGSLKANTVEGDDIKNRQIGREKMKLTAMQAFVDQGTTNNFYITPDPAATAYEDFQVFFVRALNENTGPCTFKVNALEVIPLKKRGGDELQAGDLKSGEIFIAGYYQGQFYMVSGAGANSGQAAVDTSGNLQGILYNEAKVIPVVGANQSFTHALNQLPDDYHVILECLAADAGYVAGETLPLEQISSALGSLIPSFSIKVTSSYVIVSRRYAALYDFVSGAVLDDTKWQLRVKASKEVVGSLNLVQPPISLQAVRPDGALTYGQYLYYFSRGQTDADDNRFLRSDLQTGLVELVGSLDKSFRRNHISMYRNSLGVDRLVWACIKGIHFTTLQKPAAGGWVVQDHQAAASYAYYKVLSVTEPDDSAPLTVTVWLAPQVGLNPTVGNCICKKVVLPANTQTNKVLNFMACTNAAAFAKFSSGTARIHSLTYNTAKPRFYLVDNASALLHIFDLDLTGSDFDTWLGAPDNAKLTYVQSVVIGGNGTLWSSIELEVAESITVEFDLGTGDEKAIILSQCGLINNGARDAINQGMVPGVVTRIPWRNVT